MPRGRPGKARLDSHQGFSWPWESSPLAPRDKGFPFPLGGCGPHCYYSAPSTASQSKNAHGLGSKLLGGFPLHSVLGSRRSPWTAREVWGVTVGSAVGLRPSSHKRLPKGREALLFPPPGCQLRPERTSFSSPWTEIRLESRNDLNLHVSLSPYLAAGSQSPEEGWEDSPQLPRDSESAPPWFHPEKNSM